MNGCKQSTTKRARFSVCRSKSEGGRRCPDGRRYLSGTFTADLLAPPSAEGRPPVLWRSQSLDPVRESSEPSVVCAAFKTMERHRAVEDSVTRSVEDAVPAGASLAGMEFRMKSPDSMCQKIARKIRGAARMGVSSDPDEIAGSMKDVLRYTVEVDRHDDLVPNAKHVADSMTRNGWSVVEAENMFSSGNEYKGLHMTLKGKDGVSVEVQVHSSHSLAVKEGIHGLYEEARNPAATPAARRDARDEMVRRSAEIPTPAGLDDLGTLGGCAVQKKS